LFKKIFKEVRKMQRATYNVKIPQKTADAVEEYRKQKEEQEGYPVNKTIVIAELLKKGLEKASEK
jgi:hypothetical protein